MFAQVNQGKSRYGVIAHTASLTAVDVDILIYKNGASVADADLSSTAEGTVRLDGTDPKVAHYQYATDSLAVGDTITEVIRSVGANFEPFVRTVQILAPVQTATVVPVAQVGNNSCCNQTGYVVLQ